MICTSAKRLLVDANRKAPKLQNASKMVLDTTANTCSELGRTMGILLKDSRTGIYRLLIFQEKSGAQVAQSTVYCLDTESVLRR